MNYESMMKAYDDMLQNNASVGQFAKTIAGLYFGLLTEGMTRDEAMIVVLKIVEVTNK